MTCLLTMEGRVGKIMLNQCPIAAIQGIKNVHHGDE